MNKSQLIFLVLIFLTSFVLAVDISKITNNDSSQETTTESQEGLFKRFDDKTEDVLLKEVSLGDPISNTLGVILGSKETLTWQRLIVITSVWVGFLILILGILEFLPILNKGLPKAFGAIIITLLVSITGSLRYFVDFLFNLTDSLKWFESWTLLTTILVLALSVFIIATFNWATQHFIKEKKLTEAEETGRKIRRGRQVAENLSKSI